MKLAGDRSVMVDGKEFHHSLVIVEASLKVGLYFDNYYFERIGVVEEGTSMKEFILIFRMDILTKKLQPSRTQMKLYTQQWNHWIESFAADGILTGGNHLSEKGKVLESGNKIVDGPYVSGKTSVAGYILLKAKNFNEAVRIAKHCPILKGKGTSVEVRRTTAPEE